MNRTTPTPSAHFVPHDTFPWGPILLALLLLNPGMGAAQPEPDANDRFEALRTDMVEDQLRQRGIKDEATLRAMLKVPRHKFVPPELADLAYEDTPLQIGYGQTISQPYIVGAMTELLKLKPTDRVLEVGTGSGYQAAVLGEIAEEVYSIEIIEPLGLEATERLEKLGYKNVHVKVGDGYLGWPEHAPFDAIIVTCAPDHVPQPLVEQLKPGGRMCIPVGNFLDQTLYLFTKTDDGKLKKEAVFPVIFVPLVRGDR